MSTLHPFWVHFPIALLFASFLFDLWARLTGKEGARHAGLYTLVLGLIGAVMALATGMNDGHQAAEIARIKPDPAAAERMLGLVATHRALAVAAILVFAVLLVWRLRQREAPRGEAFSTYMLVAALGAGLILSTGLSGGRIAHHRGDADRPAADMPKTGGTDIPRTAAPAASEGNGGG